MILLNFGVLYSNLLINIVNRNDSLCFNDFFVILLILMILIITMLWGVVIYDDNINRNI